MPWVDAVTILQVKVWLTGPSAIARRHTLVPATFKLRKLHGAIQVAMGVGRY